MSFFQNSVLKKYLAAQDIQSVDAAYEKYTAYFLDPAIQKNIRESKEEQFQEGFLRELFVNILGYTINPNPNFDLTTELKNIKDTKKTDGAILKNGHALAVIELKGTDTKDLAKVNDQAFNYKNNQPHCVYVITSNFEKLRFFIHNAVEHEEFQLFNLARDRFALLWLFLQKDNLLTGIPAKVKEESLLEEEKITKRLYADYSAFKEELWQDAVRQNPQHDPLLLYKKSQKLLDRFLFIFFAEDKGLLPPNSISVIIRQWEKLKELDEYKPLYGRFKKYFGYMNEGFKGTQHEIHAYNGGLFKTDALLDSLLIDDELLRRHSLRLTKYDFDDEVDTNILGHIFEHSLNDIENVRARLAGEEIDPKKTKRKKDGVFYTPKYITKYIVDNTVGQLCAAKKAEIGIDDEEFAKERKGRRKATLLKLDAQLKQYRQWLLRLTICDPACGSGAFLNQALEFLMAEHRYVDELEAQLIEGSIVFPDVEKHILEHNLFGVDINEESVEIARLSLWLRTAQKGRKLTALSENIKVGNSLIDDPTVAGDLAFDWEKEFPKVFVDGGFDVVIGNPPYVLCQPSNTPETILEYYKSFEVASYKIDLFHLFFERSVFLLKKSGALGLITPNTYLTNKYIKPLRNFLLQNIRISSIVIHEETVFPDASVDVATIIGVRSADSTYIEFTTKVEILKSKSSTIQHNNWIELEQWLNEADLVFNLKNSLLFEQKNCIPLGDICETYFGIQAYDKSSSTSDQPLTVDYLPIINGGDVNRYSFAKFSNYFNYVKKNIKSGGSWDVYAQDRIVIRQIGRFPIVGLCKKEILTSNTLYNVFPKEDSEIKLLFLLAILNSQIIKSFWESNYSDSKLLFPKIKGYQLKAIPIVKCSKVEQESLIILTKEILEITEELDSCIETFTNFLFQKFNIKLVSKKLQNWPDLDFADFLKELKKAKVPKLSLADEAEWLAYFNQQKTEAAALQSEIDRTDRAIDQKVYELYGLTEEEIALVENSI